MENSTVQLMPLTSASFALHLVLAGAATDIEEPFVLTGPTRSARTYLAVLKSSTGAILERFVLKLPVVVAGSEELTNSELEARWEAERKDQQRLREGRPEDAKYFPQLVLPAHAGHCLTPLFFCPVPRSFFSIPCPACLASLRTCRDDALLARVGLPLYSTTSIALLYCPACTASRTDAAVPRFFIANDVVDADLAKQGVESLAQLRRDLATKLDSQDPGKLEGVAARLPCLRCKEAGPCLGVGQGESKTGAGEPKVRWRPFTNRDVPFRVTQYSPLPFDHFVDILGGRVDWPNRGDLVGFSRPTGWGFLFGSEGSGLDAVEILALKLSLFQQTVQAVKAYSQSLGLPHLDLCPQHLVVESSGQGDGLAYLWNFQLRLLGTSSARLRSLGPDTEALLPPPRPLVPFCSPAVRSSCLIRTRSGELVLDRLVAENKGVGSNPRWRIEGRLSDPNGIFPKPSVRDWLLLEGMGDVLGAPSSRVAAQVDPRVTEKDSAQLAVTTQPLELEASLAGQLEQARGYGIPGVSYRVYPKLGVPEDLYSLGVLLLRTLLVNDRQNLNALEPLMESIPQYSGNKAVHELDAAGEGPVLRSLDSALADHADRLSKSNLFFQETDRVAGRPNSVPDELWREVLYLAWKLIARGPGLGLDGENYNEAHPVSHLEVAIDLVQDLVRRLHLILFQRQNTHVEIHSIIAEMLTQEDDDGTLA